MSNQYGYATPPSPVFKNGTLNPFARSVGNRRHTGTELEQDMNRKDLIIIKSISLQPVEKLIANSTAPHAVKLRNELRAAKHTYYSLLGMSSTLTITFALITIQKYWALFFLVPVLLGFIEMYITIKISQTLYERNN